MDLSIDRIEKTDFSLAKIFNRAIILVRDISNLGNLIESAWSWKSRRG